jgi:hypothetical protein
MSKWDIFDRLGNKIGEVIEESGDGGGLGILLGIVFILIVGALLLLSWPIAIKVYLDYEDRVVANAYAVWFLSFPVISLFSSALYIKLTKMKLSFFRIFMTTWFLTSLIVLLFPIEPDTPWLGPVFLSFGLSFFSAVFGVLFSAIFYKFLK